MQAATHYLPHNCSHLLTYETESRGGKRVVFTPITRLIEVSEHFKAVVQLLEPPQPGECRSMWQRMSRSALRTKGTYLHEHGT